MSDAIADSRGGDDGDGSVGDGQRAPTLHVEITGRALAWVSVALFTVIVVIGIFDPAEEAVTRIVIGAVLALALDPLVRALQDRGLGRRPAASIVGGGLLAAGAIVVLVVGPPAIEQAQRFSEELPQTVQGFYELPLVGDWLEDNDAATRVDEFVAELPSQIDDETIESTANSFLGTALGALLVFAVAFAVMLDG